MILIKAGPAEILRSSQKDDYVIKKLQKWCEDVLFSIMGPRMLIKYKTAIQNIGELLYFGNTTLCGLQTLGEEYTGILEVNDSLTMIPSMLTRLLMVLLHCFGSNLSILFINELENNVKENVNLKKNTKKKLLCFLFMLRSFLPSIEVLHKAIFYCNWGTYHISKRISGINYVLTRYWLQDKKSLFGFKVLGIVTLINFILHSFQSISVLMNKEPETLLMNEISTHTTYSTTSNHNCIMCLNTIKNPTATMCGHIFCWTCLHEWVQNTEKCPVCREPVYPSRLIPLHNYI